jgi:hypothetical protein
MPPQIGLIPQGIDGALGRSNMDVLPRRPDQAASYISNYERA